MITTYHMQHGPSREDDYRSAGQKTLTHYETRGFIIQETVTGLYLEVKLSRYMPWRHMEGEEV
jgi:hypothetical protein